MYEIGLNLSTIDTTAQFKLGTVISTPGTAGPTKTYKYIKYLAASAAIAGVAGNVCYYPTVAIQDAAGDIDNTTVTSDLSDSLEVGAGVLQASLTDGSFGWIQVRGMATVTTALTAGADGDPLTPTGSTDGTLDVVAAVTDDVCATAIDISAKIINCCFKY